MGTTPHGEARPSATITIHYHSIKVTGGQGTQTRCMRMPSPQSFSEHTEIILLSTNCPQTSDWVIDSEYTNTSFNGAKMGSFQHFVLRVYTQASTAIEISMN